MSEGVVNNQLAEYRLQMMKKRQQQGGSAPAVPQEATVSKQEEEILERARIVRTQEVEAKEAKQKEEQTKKPKVSEGLIEAAKKWTSEEGAKVQNKTLLSPTSMKRQEQEKMFVDVPTNEEPLSPTSINCIIQIRLPDGNVLKAQFQSEDLLSTICDYVIQQTNSEELKKGMLLSTGFPRRVRFEAAKLQTTTLVAAGLVPNGNVLVEKAENGYKQEEKKVAKVYTQLDYSELSNQNGLKGYSIKEIDEFKEKQRLIEVEKIKREKELKKQQLRTIRAQVAAEKAERIQKNAESSASKPVLTAPVASSSTTTSSSASTATSAVLQIRLPTGSPVTITLKPGDSLYNVHEQLLKLGKISSSDKYSFIAIPRKEYQYSQWRHTPLTSVGVVPRGSLIVQPSDMKGKVVKGEAAPPVPASNSEEEDQE